MKSEVTLYVVRNFELRKLEDVVDKCKSYFIGDMYHCWSNLNKKDLDVYLSSRKAVYSTDPMTALKIYCEMRHKKLHRLENEKEEIRKGLERLNEAVGELQIKYTNLDICARCENEIEFSTLEPIVLVKDGKEYHFCCQECYDEFNL